MNIELHAVRYIGVVQLALEKRLSTYDASYLWLARSMAIPLVTLDQRLRQAASE